MRARRKSWLPKPLAPLLLGLAAAWPAMGHAQEEAPAYDLLSRVWINPGFYSYHWDRNKNLENQNWGLGLEYVLNDQWSLTAGAFRNSDRERSRYVGAYFMPFQWQGLKFGAALGVFDGYPHYRDGDWFPALIPSVVYESSYWGLNVGVVPSYKDRLHGAISFQLKVRFGAPPSAGSSR